MAQQVKCPMRQPYKTSNTAIGTRLEEAIQQMWGSHRALAQHTGIQEGTISKYVRHGRLPAGAEMVKLAQALPGQIEYILTGIRPTTVQMQTVGSLPLPLQEAVARGLDLSSDLQHRLAQCARILASGEPDLIRMLTDPAQLLEETLIRVRRTS